MLSRWASNGSRVWHMEIQVAAMPPHFEDLKPHESQLKRSCPPQMGPSGGQVAPSWSRWAEVWSQVGPRWAGVEACWLKLTPSGADVAVMSDRNNAFETD